MALNYPNQAVFVAIGTKSGTTPGSIAMTGSYQAESGATKPTKTFPVGGYSKMNLDLLYTMGATESSNSIEVKIEASSDGVNFYRIPNDSTSGGTSTLTAREFTFVGTDAAAATISAGLDIFYKYIKVWIKESGVVTNAGTIFGEVTLSGR